jgi:hypothetical protein
MPILNSIFTLFNLKRLSQVEEMRTNPVQFQQETFLNLIRRAENTNFGLKYDFSSINSVKTFQDRVPLNSYDDLKPYIERMIKGEANVLWPKEVRWYAKSSGTTNDKSKFIPVSREALEDCHFKAGKDTFMLFSRNYPSSNILSGKSLTLGGSHQVSPLNEKTQIGDLSAIYIQNLPFFFDLKRTPEVSIALISEFEQKINRIAEVAVNEDVTSVVGVPSWNLVLLKHVLEFTGKKNISQVWPNLELFVHGGINFEPYREQYQKIIPSPKMKYMETYNASEGFFAIQDDPADQSMMLMMDYGIFYEFIPLEELESPNPKVLTVADVEVNKNYAIVITTNAGLWRYLIGDTVMFSSLFPHKLRITGRTKQYINAFGEELMVDNAEKAIIEACKMSGAIVTEYTVAPVFMSDKSKGKHQWLIEFEKKPDDLLKFTQTLDEHLQKVNSDYEAKRHRNATLEQLEVTVALNGLFMKWMKNRGKLGGQNKVPRLSNTRQYIDELLPMNSQ